MILIKSIKSFYKDFIDFYLSVKTRGNPYSIRWVSVFASANNRGKTAINRGKSANSRGSSAINRGKTAINRGKLLFIADSYYEYSAFISFYFLPE